MAESLGDFIQQARERLSGKSESAFLDVQVLAAHILNRSRTWVLAHPEAALTAQQTSALDDALQQMIYGTPLPYIVGEWAFYGRQFTVTPAVLIPRPETELLIDLALAWLHENPSRRTALDVGTGSGCIGITLAAQTPDLQVLAVDISSDALTIAQQNAARHAVSNRITFRHTNLLHPLDHLPLEDTYDLVCGNLPYIPTSRLPHLEVTQHEPSLALDGGPNGLNLIAQLLEQISSKTRLGGKILLEIDVTQKDQVLYLARQTFPLAQAVVHQDLTGRDRILTIQTE